MQDDAIILTESTFRFGVEDADAEVCAPVVEPDLRASATVPVISTLWPTCGDSFESSPCRLYELAVERAAPLVPAVPALLEEELAIAFFSTNLASAEVLAAPVVPVGELLAWAFSTQPVMVTLSEPAADFEGV